MDDRIQIFRNSKNLGPGLSRNVGLDNAKGNYIAFLDSDDYWDKDFLITTLKVIKKNRDVAFVYAKTIAFDKNRKNSRRDSSSYFDAILPNILLNKRGWNSSSCLWNTEFIGKIRFIQTKNWEDYAFDVEVGLHNNTVKFINKYLVYCDSGGEDKLSKTRYLYRSLEKSVSLLRIYSLLKNTDYVKNEAVKKFLVSEFITVLELIRLTGHKDENLNEEILASLKGLQTWGKFNFVSFVFRNFNNKLAPKFLNKFKKHFY